jgi:hypothetical protein
MHIISAFIIIIFARLLKLFLITAGGDERQPGKGKSEKDVPSSSRSKGTKEEATDPTKGMGPNLLLMKVTVSSNVTLYPLSGSE